MANNPYVNKVEDAAGNTIMDITDTTVESGDVLSGEVFYTASGQRSTGSLSLSSYVTGPSSATDTHVAAFDGTTGKAIKDSGYTIASSVPANAVFTDTTYTEATSSSSGLMSYGDKSKLDGIAAGANKITKVSELTNDSGYTTNTGTITGITMNGASKGTSGVVDLGTVITSHQDISDKVSGPSSATANAVAIYDGTGGKTIKDSGYTIGKSVPSDAKFTDTTYESKAAASGGTDVSLVTTGEKYTWNSKTSNTGTVTKVSTGAGLTGGDITTTGTISISGMNTSSGSTSKCLTEKGTWASFTNNAGTITGITMNGASKGTSGVVDLGTVITAHQDISGKVTGPASSTDAHVAVFNGTGGKTIKDSGYTIATSVPANAVFTDTDKSTKFTCVKQIGRGTNIDPIQSGYFAGMSASTGIDSKWWHILSMDWSSDSADNWISQLALPTADSTAAQKGLQYRTRQSSTTSAWVKCLDTDNYTSYAAKKTEAIKNISRSGTTFTATRCDGTTFTFTQQDNDHYAWSDITGKPVIAQLYYRNSGSTATTSGVVKNLLSKQLPAGKYLVTLKTDLSIHTTSVFNNYIVLSGGETAEHVCRSNGVNGGGMVNVCTIISSSDVTVNTKAYVEAACNVNWQVNIILLA